VARLTKKFLRFKIEKEPLEKETWWFTQFQHTHSSFHYRPYDRKIAVLCKENLKIS